MRILQWCVLAIVLSFAACVTATEPLTECQDPRPQMCTMEYKPVCAELVDSKLNSTIKTYSSGCSACSDKQVKGYRGGACENEEKAD